MSRPIVCSFVGLLAVLSTTCKSSTPKPQSTSADVAGAGSELKDLIEDTIEDEVKRERLLFLLDEADRITVEYKKSYLDARLIWEDNPDIDKEGAIAKWAEYAEVRIDFIRSIVKLRLEMRKLVTKEEWQALFVDKEEDKKKTLPPVPEENKGEAPKTEESAPSPETETPPSAARDQSTHKEVKKC